MNIEFQPTKKVNPPTKMFPNQTNLEKSIILLRVNKQNRLYFSISNLNFVHGLI